MKGALRNTDIKFSNGERIDLKEFFTTYYPELSAFANKFISDPTVCEDIVQDIFVSFWEKQKTFENLVSAKAFLYTSTRNSCLDYLKHCKVEEKYVERRKFLYEETESFLDEIIKAEAYSEVYREINKLPDMGKNVLLLAMKEKSNEEIAKILNIALNTVRTHKARAYKVLRKNLGDLLLVVFPVQKRTFRLK